MPSDPAISFASCMRDGDARPVARLVARLVSVFCGEAEGPFGSDTDFDYKRQYSLLSNER